MPPQIAFDSVVKIYLNGVQPIIIDITLVLGPLFSPIVNTLANDLSLNYA